VKTWIKIKYWKVDVPVLSKWLQRKWKEEKKSQQNLNEQDSTNLL
jgi:hypothetical protein